MSYKCVPWAGKVDSEAQLGVLSSVLVPLQYSGHLHVPLGTTKSRPESVLCSCQDLPIAFRYYQHPSHLPAMFRAFSPGNLPWSHLQSLLLLLTDRTVLIGTLYLRGHKRNRSKFSPYLYCGSPHNVHSFHRPTWPPQASTPGYAVTGSNDLLILKRGSSHRCSNCVFLDSVFVCLAPINYRTKLMAKVVYISPEIQSPYSEPPHLTLTSQLNISPALNQPRAGTKQLGTTPSPKPTRTIQMSSS